MSKAQKAAGADWAPRFVRELWNEAQAVIGGAEKQAQNFFAQLVEKGHVSQEEAARALGEMVKRTQKSRDEMARFLEGRVDAMCRALHLPTKSEVERLQRRVAAVRSRLESLAKAIGEKP